MCSPPTTAIGSAALVSRVSTTNSSSIGVTRPTNRWTPSGQRANTRMKLMRYRASGTTHRSGTGARSVETCVVTPRSRLDGSAASATHRRMRPVPIGAGGTASVGGGAAAPSGPSAGAGGRSRSRHAAHASTISRYTPTPVAQTHCWAASVSRGSIKSG